MLEKFEEKIENIKEKIGQKNLDIFFFTIFCIVALVFMVCAKEYKKQKQEVQDSYNRAMYDFVTDTKNIQNEMLKLKITSSDTYTLTTLATIFAKASSANSNLEILPFSAQSIANTSKFLNQLSDFSYNLMRDILNGDDIEEYKENIDTLYEKISELARVTENIYIELNDGKIKWDELETIGDAKIKEANADEEVSSVNYIGKTFTEYEGIIYDGAFSNHILTMEPAFLTGEDKTYKEAEEILKEKLDIDEIKYLSEQDGTIALYVYDVKLKDTDTIKTVYVTKKDAKIYEIISDKVSTEENLSIDDAKNVAKAFLETLGIYDIEPTYYLASDNMVTISFAATQDGVIIYSDLIKIKVDLQDGEIMTFEAEGYIYNHKTRNITPTHTVDEAREILYSELNIESERLCIIPTDSKDEVLVYEFKGTADDKTFLVYVNANTLVEEKIYILLETEGGTLAI